MHAIKGGGGGRGKRFHERRLVRFSSLQNFKPRTYETTARSLRNPYRKPFVAYRKPFVAYTSLIRPLYANLSHTDIPIRYPIRQSYVNLTHIITVYSDILRHTTGNLRLIIALSRLMIAQVS